MRICVIRPRWVNLITAYWSRSNWIIFSFRWGQHILPSIGLNSEFVGPSMPRLMGITVYFAYTNHWHFSSTDYVRLAHWDRVTHICVGTIANIGSDNGLSPGWCQAIIWTNAGILLIGLLGTNCSGILSKIHTSSFKKMHFKTSSAK